MEKRRAPKKSAQSLCLWYRFAMSKPGGQLLRQTACTPHKGSFQRAGCGQTKPKEKNREGADE